MIDMQIVEKAEVFPHRCAKCSGNVGPFLDTNAEFEMAGLNYRIYLCKRVCARSVARVCGFAPGKKMEELASAAERVEEMEKELAAEKQVSEKLREDLALRLEVNSRLDAAYNREVGRVHQLEKSIGERAKYDLQLVTGSPDWADIDLGGDAA